MRSHNTWIARASEDNTPAIATKEADEFDRPHHITGVHASFSGSATGLLQIKSGDTVIFEHYVQDTLELIFDMPLQCASGQPVSAELAASGSAGVIGKVNVIGFTY